ncbi:hypothetical protein BU25DRAFT_103583 [Macroventuria anomochaeta]|uniref:Uncharacterized protein n=1 Tax=Macroventuria anomochaeta TaxID=301207 RepID=A0ACB6RWP4_9PLEO|nr:uncharacterized protein BU25DRAFT_103583 [Macroventuria anomochaeta]KAF2626194.1 hypothetical protein BU25DRAFT_103583 [Macroventuria anomochaeta]
MPVYPLFHSQQRRHPCICILSTSSVFVYCHHHRHKHLSTMVITRAQSSSTRKRSSDAVQLDEKGFNWAPWAVEERHVVYEYLNAWVQQYGLDAFCTKKWAKEEFVFLTNTINEVNAANDADTAPRSMMNVKRQIRHLYEGRLSPLAKLWKRSEDLKLSIELGRAVEESERFPQMTVPVATLVDGIYIIKSGEKEAKKMDKEVGNEAETPETPPAKEQKEKIVKLSVEWTRLHVRRDGGTSVLREGEVWESPVTNGGSQESVSEDDGSEPMSFSEGEEGERP